LFKKKVHFFTFFRLSETLLDHETIDFHMIYDILGDKPFEPKENFKKYLEEVIKEFGSLDKKNKKAA